MSFQESSEPPDRIAARTIRERRAFARIIQRGDDEDRRALPRLGRPRRHARSRKVADVIVVRGNPFADGCVLEKPENLPVVIKDDAIFKDTRGASR